MVLGISQDFMHASCIKNLITFFYNFPDESADKPSDNPPNHLQIVQRHLMKLSLFYYFRKPDFLESGRIIPSKIHV